MKVDDVAWGDRNHACEVSKMIECSGPEFDALVRTIASKLVSKMFDEGNIYNRPADETTPEGVTLDADGRVCVTVKKR